MSNKPREDQDESFGKAWGRTCKDFLVGMDDIDEDEDDEDDE
jgi:hypothetical protein